MTTTTYIARHLQSFRKYLGEYNVNEMEQVRNEKKLLTRNVLYSSHYFRTMAIAKYIAESNKI